MSDAGNDAALPDGVQAAVLDDRSSLDTAFSRDEASPETRFSIAYVGRVIRQLRFFKMCFLLVFLSFFPF